MDIALKPIETADDEYKYEVTLDDRTFIVTFSEDYYQKITLGRVHPDVLVKKSFSFLLEREPVGSILQKFDLSVIQSYFPDYEAKISHQ